MAVGGAFGAIFARWLSFVSIFLIIGTVTFRLVIIGRMSRPPGDLFTEIASTNAATLGITASAGAILGAALKLARESADMPDVSAASMVFGSLWGWSILGQMIAAIAAAAAFRKTQTAVGKARATAWNAALIAAAVLAVMPSLASHAASADLAWLAIPVDMMHVVVGSVWLGTLAAIVIVGISAALKTPDDERPGARVASMINAFSPVALICGGSVVGTGVASSVLHLPQVRALWTTPYGIALLLKLFFVAMLFGAGAWNWKRMKPRLTGEDAIAPMKSSATFELLVAGAVLGATALLVALELP